MNSHKYFGLSGSQISLLEEKFGENILKEKLGPSILEIFFNQFKSPLIYVLLFAAGLSIYFKEYSNFWIIFAVVFVNSAMGFYQEFSAQKTLRALEKILQPTAVVVRNGKRQEIEARKLLPGDIVILAAGDQVPADGKTIEAANLLVNEAILTGEEDAVDKKPNEDAPLFMGTTILSGVGLMKVEKTGVNAEIGKISESLSEIKETETLLERKLAKFSNNLVLAVLVVCIIILIFGLIKNHNFWAMLEFAIVLSVAAIPEGLPIAATVILSMGMKRILKKKGLVKRLQSVETLGSTSVICTDKTGTLTEGKMQVVKVDLEKDPRAFLSLILANQQKDTLEVSLWQYVEKHSKLHPKEILSKVDKVYEEPFDSLKKYSLSIIKKDGEEISYILGAPEIVLDFCQIDKKKKQKVISTINEWSSLGLKVIGAAFKDKGELKSKSGWSFLGLAGIEDPVRPEVFETVKKCQKAGIKIKIVTGDFRQTAEKVASLIGLNYSDENVMEASELERISDKELEARIENIIIFSRITPHQKLKIVKALQNNGEVVAMTGDGVNDALALKKADIAVVVANASDVAKEVSDLILLDSNFKTIYAACEEGRIIIQNIKKVVSFVLSNSFVGIVVIFTAVLLSLPAPITVIMILWINLICDGPIDIMLGFEEEEAGIMLRSPKTIQKEKILDRFVIQTCATISLFVGLSAVFMFSYFYNAFSDLSLARTITFACVSSASLFYVFSFKNLQQSIIRNKNLLKNKLLIVAVVYGFVLVSLVIYLPFFNQIFKTKPLYPVHWLLVISVGLLATILVEISKKTYNRSKIVKN